ncbi:hypothetical protein CUMW_077180 [Citrus unshiu]|nr:hypothetical protein CUMW_077180 [Citrus unshiu]
MGLPRKQRIHQTLSIVVLVPILLIAISSILASANISKKLDQELVPPPQIPDTSIKCGTCPCVNPCGQLPPPPPPPPPPPSPPKTTYCPPQVQTPPPPRFIYVTGEPGEIYHTDSDDWGFYSTAQPNVAKNRLLLAACGVLGLFIIW